MPHLRQCSFSDCGETESKEHFSYVKNARISRCLEDKETITAAINAMVSQELLLWFKVFYKLIRIKLFLPAQGGSIRSIFVITLSIKVNTGQG